MFCKLFFGAWAQRQGQHVGSYFFKKQLHIAREDVVYNISVSHIRECFKQQCLNATEGYACIVADCPICHRTKKTSKLYVNKTTGFFMCGACASTGSWNILESYLSKSISEENRKELDILMANSHSRESFTETWKDLIKKCQSVTDLSMDEYKILLDSFSLPHVPQEDISQLNCFYERTAKVLHFPLLGLNDTIVGYTSLTTSAEREQTVPISGAGGCLTYKQNRSENENSAVVVGMIDDLLALMLKKPTYTIICLPYNLRSLPQQLLPYMEAFKKLILWFGNEETNWCTAKQFAKKLNEKRCYFVRPIDSQPRPKIAIEMNHDLKTILRNAQPVWHQSIITFQDLREDVLSDLQNNDKVQGVQWKRYPALNRLLKGHRRGEFTVLTGPTGCGKTTFMSEYSIDLAMQGINTLWGSFEIRNVRLARTMLQQMVGSPLDENLEKFDAYANAFEKLPIYFMTFHGQQSIKVVMDTVEHATYVHDIAHVIIDNVQFMMGTSDATKYMDRFWKQDDIIARFRNFASKNNCHVTMIIHPRKERCDDELTTLSIFGSAKASQEADNVLIIQDNRLHNVRGKKYLQIAKNRYSGDLGIMVLDFDKSSLSYAPKSKVKGKHNEKTNIVGKEVVVQIE